MDIQELIKKYHWITHPYLHNILTAIVFMAAMLGLWFGAEGALLDYWNEKVVLAYLCSITSNWVLTTACVFLTICVLIVTVYRFIIRYQYRISVICVALIIAVLLFYYRFIDANLYDYVALCNNGLKYVDFLLIWLCIYIVASAVNFKYSLYHKEPPEVKQAAKAKTKRLEDGLLIPVLQSDNPIDSLEEDELDYKNEIQKLTKEIIDLDPSHSWSIAISAPWGSGKTSFMNLLKKSLSPKDFKQINFAPRNSKSAETIQTDFFNKLVEVVAQTDVRVKNTMQDYMEFLGVIDNTGILSKITQLGLWKEGTSKQLLEDIFSEYSNRIIVFVEDFDRLTCPEIIEVLKLIDNNAAFPNIIFITAYDKENVNAMLRHDGLQNSVPFTDKFFSFEYTLPQRPYSYIKRYLKELLACIIDNERHKEALDEMFNEYKQEIDVYLQPCIATLRDAKRFYNMFATDYAHLQEDVIFKEFLFVELLKYHYPEIYHKLHTYEYLIGADATWELQENIHVDEIVNKILKDLFLPKKVNEFGDKLVAENSYRHIYDKAYFDNYFINGVYGYLRIKDMRKTIEAGLTNSKETIDKWFDDEVKKTDYCLFLDDVIQEDFTSKEQYFNYVNIYLYVVIHHHNKMLSWSKGNILQKQYVQWRLDKLGVSEEEYNAHLLKSLNDVSLDPLMRAQRDLILELEEKKEEQDGYYISRDNIYPILKKQFVDILKDSSVAEKDKYLFLISCHERLGNSITLDEVCCSFYRKYIIHTPAWFIANFVILTDQSLSKEINTITCHPFSEQIFGGKKEIYSFLFMKDNDVTPHIQCARNFWKLFIANEYKPIEFHNQGNVQAKIDNDLVEENVQMEELKGIAKDVNKLYNQILSHIITAKQAQLRMKKLEKQLEQIHLYIRINGRIREKLNECNKRINQAQHHNP